MTYYFDVPLIGQDYNIGCWAASIRMIFAAAGRGNPIGARLFPSATAFYNARDAARNQRTTQWTSWSSIKKTFETKTPGGIGATPHDSDCSEILKVLHETMLQPIPCQPDTYSANWLKNNLPDYGPMFVGGYWGVGQSFHAVVIRGVDASKPEPIMINDPWPVRRGGQIQSMAFGTFNGLKEPELPIHYLRHNWRCLCKGLPPNLGGPNP
jgi:hypothetical protein